MKSMIGKRLLVVMVTMYQTAPTLCLELQLVDSPPEAHKES